MKRKVQRSGRGLGERVHPDMPARTARGGAFAAVYALVKKIPRGRVMTYGQIAALLGSRLSPRAIGWAMHGCPRDVPWQRVVNAQGRCSTDKLPNLPGGLQQALLAREGVEFSASGTLDLELYRWQPRTRRSMVTRSKRAADSARRRAAARPSRGGR